MHFEIEIEEEFFDLYDVENPIDIEDIETKINCNKVKEFKKLLESLFEKYGEKVPNLDNRLESIVFVYS